MNVEIEINIINGIRHRTPISKPSVDPSKGRGYYAIWIINREKLRKEFSDELSKRKTDLLYIGIAETSSLYERMYLQELQHHKAATFFRSIGAVLGYFPEKGSLLNTKSCNYKFIPKHTKEIISWIDKNLEVSYYHSSIENNLEKRLIEKYSPILNWQHNLNKFRPLKEMKDECRRIARIG